MGVSRRVLEATLLQVVHGVNGGDKGLADRLVALDDDTGEDAEILAGIAEMGSHVGLEDFWELAPRGPNRVLHLGYVDRSGPLPRLLAEMPVSALSDETPETRARMLADFVGWTERRVSDVAAAA